MEEMDALHSNHTCEFKYMKSISVIEIKTIYCNILMLFKLPLLGSRHESPVYMLIQEHEYTIRIHGLGGNDTRSHEYVNLNLRTYIDELMTNTCRHD